MKKTILILLLVLPSLAQAQMETMLKVIAIKETGEKPSTPRTQYQFTRDAWEESSDMPWSYVLAHPDWADVQAEARAAAHRRVLYIIERLEANGKSVNPYAIAYCWRGGITSYVKHKRKLEYHRYATEASNLFFHYEQGFATNGNGYAFSTQ